MNKKRQDSWTTKEDQLLANCVISHVQKNSTQLKAFEEAGKKLSRTAAACGFRWNSHVRKLYADELIVAKQERENRKVKKRKKDSVEPENRILSMDGVLLYLRNMEQEFQTLLQKNEELETYINQLKRKNQELVDLNTKMKTQYRNFMLIMEQARKMTLSEERKQQSPLSKDD